MSESNQQSTALPAIPESHPANRLPAEVEPVQVPALFGQHFEVSAHNFGTDPAVVFEQAMLAKNGETLALADHVNETLHIEHFYAHAVELCDDGGQIHDEVRTVLFTSDGRMFHAVSKGVFDFLRSAVMAYGMEKFDPPLRVKVLSKTTRKGWRLLTLIPVQSANQ